MMALRMISFFLSNVCMNFPWTFFLFVFFFSKQKSDFFSYVIESSDLCACSIFFLWACGSATL